MADATFTMKVRMDSGDLSVDLREIVQDFGSFKQDFRRISEGLTKEISKLSESLKNFTPDSKYVKSVGQTFADDIKRSLNPVRLMSGIVSGTFAGVVRNWIKEMFGDKTKDFLKSSFTTLTGVATKGLDEIVKIFKEGIPALMENFKHQLGVWKILMKPYLSKIKKGAIDTLNKTKEILGNIAKYISTIFKNAVTSVGTYLTKIKTSIGRYLTKIKASITKAVTALKKALLPKLKLLLGPKGLILAAVIGLVTFIAKNWDEIKEAALAVWDAVTEFAQNALQTIQEIWGAVAEWFNTTIIEPLQEFFTLFWETAKELASSAWESIKETWNIVTSWFNDNIISPLKSTFSDAWESIRDFAISAWEGIRDLWDTVTNWFNNNIITPLQTAFNTLWEGVSNAVLTSWDTVTSIVRNSANTVLGVIEGIINSVVNAVNGLTSSINNVLSSIRVDLPDWLGGRSFSLNINVPQLPRIQIPQLATGAVIQPNNPFLAILGDQRKGQNIEAPLSTIEDAVSNVYHSIAATAANPFSKHTIAAMTATGARMGGSNVTLDNKSIASIVNGINKSTAMSLTDHAINLMKHKPVQLEPSGTQLSRALVPFILEEFNRLGLEVRAT